MQDTYLIPFVMFRGRCEFSGHQIQSYSVDCWNIFYKKMENINFKFSTKNVMFSFLPFLCNFENLAVISE